MFITEYGSRNDPTLILLAPMMVSGSDLYKLMKPFLRGRYHIIAPDQGGHGKAGAYTGAEEMAKGYHVYLMIADGHDELGTRSLRLMKLACPPERWTPEGEDPEEHYRALLKFYRQHYSARTVYNVFWSTDNYSMPDSVPKVAAKIEYWYGEEEKRAREKEHDIEFVRKAFPQTVFKEFKGLAHAELVMMFPERFAFEVKRFLEEENGSV